MTSFDLCICPGYLKFAYALEGLLVQWGLGSMGFSAYRRNFCSRSLTIEVRLPCVMYKCADLMHCQFMYVWILILLVDAFVEPTRRLIETLPAYKQLLAKMSARCSPPSETEQTLEECVEQTLAATFKMQASLSNTFLVFLTALIFGTTAPILPLIALLGSWLNFCSSVWVSRAEQGMPFGQLLAATVLVQPPMTAVQIMAMGMVAVLSVFIFVDMSFDVGPIALYMVFNSVVIPLSFVRSQLWIRMCYKINNFVERIILSEGASAEGCRDGVAAIDEVVIEKNVIIELCTEGAFRSCHGSLYFPQWFTLSDVSPDLSHSGQ